MSALRNRFRSLAMNSNVERTTFFRQKFQALNYKSEISEKGDVTLLHPGVSYGDFQGAYPCASRMGLLSEACLYNITFNSKSKTGSPFVEFDAMNQDHLTITASNKLKIEPSLFDASVLKSPLDVKIRLCDVGKTTLCFETKVYSPNSDILLFSNILRCIRMDVSVRKPVPLPDWWREKYTPLANPRLPLVIQSDPRPNDVILRNAYVTNHDADYQGHTNWASYIKFCIDNAFMLNVESKLRHVSEKAVFDGFVKTVQTRYTGESFTGDVLKVSTWENPDIANTVHFELHRGESPVCNASIEYYDSGF